MSLIDPQEPFTVLVSLRQVSEWSGRTVQIMTESSSARAAVGISRKLGQLSVANLPLIGNRSKLLKISGQRG